MPNAEKDALPISRQNAPVVIFTYPLNRLFCWHSREHLRQLGSSNGKDIYCGKCGRKRFAYIVRGTG